MLLLQVLKSADVKLRVILPVFTFWIVFIIGSKCYEDSQNYARCLPPQFSSFQEILQQASRNTSIIDKLSGKQNVVSTLLDHDQLTLLQKSVFVMARTEKERDYVFLLSDETCQMIIDKSKTVREYGIAVEDTE